MLFKAILAVSFARRNVSPSFVDRAMAASRYVQPDEEIGKKNLNLSFAPKMLVQPEPPLRPSAFAKESRANMDKERAEKAMREAEEKFQSNDIEGAKRMVLRARKLFPSAPGLPQMLAAFNVHIAAASKDAKGRTNWYAVLDVDPSDDIKTIKKQYKKLCLLIHPDKNRSSAAEGAFKLVCQAWEVINGNANSSEKASTGTGGSPSDSGAGDQHSSTSGARSSSRPSSTQSDPKTTRSSSARSDHKTTWSSSSRSDPRTTWSSSTRWNTDKSSSKADVACPKCSRNCKSLDSGDLIIRCSYCNLFAVRGRQDSSVFSYH